MDASAIERRAAAVRRRLAKAERRRSRLPERLAELRTRLDPDTAQLREAWIDTERAEAYARKAVRDGEAQLHYGHPRGAANCFSCGHFKTSPAAVCGHCGDDPVTYGGDRRDFNRAYGRAT
jgi:hypothetical protein